MDFAITSLDMFAGTSENLINYAFNVCFLYAVMIYVNEHIHVNLDGLL
jgi:hypothetical protein